MELRLTVYGRYVAQIWVQLLYLVHHIRAILLGDIAAQPVVYETFKRHIRFLFPGLEENRD